MARRRRRIPLPDDKLGLERALAKALSSSSTYQRRATIALRCAKKWRRKADEIRARLHAVMAEEQRAADAARALATVIPKGKRRAIELVPKS